MRAYLYARVKACLYCAYLYAFSSFQVTEHRGNRILFPPLFPWKQKPFSVSIFPVPPGHWLALLLVQHALTIRDSRHLTGARTYTPRHHTGVTLRIPNWKAFCRCMHAPHLTLPNRLRFILILHYNLLAATATLSASSTSLLPNLLFTLHCNS